MGSGLLDQEPKALRPRPSLRAQDPPLGPRTFTALRAQDLDRGTRTFTRGSRPSHEAQDLNLGQSPLLSAQDPYPGPRDPLGPGPSFRAQDPQFGARTLF